MVGIVAPSSVVPKIELELALELLAKKGFQTKIHPNTFKCSRFFAGTDHERAQALYDFATDSECDVIWCARGGYGSARLLPYLDELVTKHGSPRPGKLLVGYSDATALFDYVRRDWGWSALHASMPGLRSFFQLTRAEYSVLFQWLKREMPIRPWGAGAKLKWVGGAKAQDSILATMAGGNLAVWTSLVGTPYFPETHGKILFFEEIGEYPYRIDRLVNQLELAESFENVSAIVLGDFLDCEDQVSQVFAARPKKGIQDPALKKPPRKTQPLRKRLDGTQTIYEIFGDIGVRHGFPIFAGLPVGHGPGHFSLPIGARYRLSPKGELQLESWNWLR